MIPVALVERIGARPEEGKSLNHVKRNLDNNIDGRSPVFGLNTLGCIWRQSVNWIS